MNIEIKDIRSLFSQAYFQRGQKLMMQGKVKLQGIKKIDSSSISITSKVQGTNVYSQDICLSYDHQLELDINGSCSCPIGYNCKHVVAVCLVAQQQIIANKNLQIEAPLHQGDDKFIKWLNNLEEDVEELSHSDQPNKLKWYTFHLFEQRGDNYSTARSIEKELQIVLNKYTARGRLSKPKKVTLNKYVNDNEEWHADRNIKDLCSNFIEQQYSYYSDEKNVFFAGLMGYLFLKGLIATKRAYFKQNNQPLTWSEEVYDLKLEYNKEQDKTQNQTEHKLSFNITQQHFIVLCSPPILINTQNQVCQKIVTSLDIEVIRSLLNIPAIKTLEQLDQIVSILELQEIIVQAKTPFKKSSLPNIEALKPKIIKNKPSPVLYLEKSNMLLFSVYFGYTENIFISLVEQSEIIKTKEEGLRIELHRDLEQEQVHLQEVSSLIQRLLVLPIEIDPTQTPLKELMFCFDETFQFTEQEQWSARMHLQANVYPVLEKLGWIIDVPKNIDIKPIKNVEVESSDKNNWFELNIDIKVGNKKTSIEPVIKYLLQNYNQASELPDTLYIPLDQQNGLSCTKQQIAPIFNTFLQLYGEETTNFDQLKFQPFDAHLIQGLSDMPIKWHGKKDSLKLANKLANFKGIEEVAPPKGLNATLRNYQQFGLNWLNFLHQFKFNGILADDMGLGKTLQTLTWLLKLKENQQLKQPVLLIVPTSLIGNWKAESKRFTPSLNLLTLHGADRAECFAEIMEHDIVLTSYPLIVKDIATLKKINFLYLVLDEAQKIKNPKTKLYASLLELKSEHRLCLTGTPMENHLGEVWSIFNFLMPGFLNNLPQFKKTFQNPIEKEHSPSAQKLFNQKISPFLLRRNKKEVATELPDKTEIIKTVEFDNPQAQLYETVRLTMEESIRNIVSEKGLAKSQIMILDALLKLRQVCCHPALVKIEAAKKVKHSAKLEMLMDLVTELTEANHKIILFSQFTSMLKIIEDRFNKAKIKYSLLTGQTRKREEAIEHFKSGETQVFLISLKAGGVGLNLVEADTVIHYDPWWNPAVENQATDRAHRIGQNKEVFVYKLIVANTIEEKIIALQAKKQALQDQLYDQKEIQKQEKLTGEDLMKLLISE